MSMLAERKKRMKWTLNPGRRAIWNSACESSGLKFGQGLMEKMGWKVGQGLGANEQGMTEPLRISVKTDCKGIGFKDTDSIEWVQQQHDFNKLLRMLSTSDSTIGNENNAEEVKTRTSLEEKSKHSRTRVHYHKFTRGKDLSKYSEKDLECILGGRKELSYDCNNKKYEGNSCLKPDTDPLITQAGSMFDYFSKKMKNKQTVESSNVSHNSDCVQEFDGVHDVYNAEPQDKNSVKRKKKKEKEKKMQLHNELDEDGIKNEGCENHYLGNKDVMKGENKHGNKYIKQEMDVKNFIQDKNNKKNGGEDIINNFTQNFSDDNSEYRDIKKHKKKKRKEWDDEENGLCGNSQLENEKITKCKKMKLDDKCRDDFENVSSLQKKEGKREKYVENNSDCYAKDENKESKHCKRRIDDEYMDEERKKERKEEKAKKSKKVVCESSTENEEKHCKMSKVDECAGVCRDVIKSKKKEKRKEEKAEEISNNIRCEGLLEKEEIIDHGIEVDNEKISKKLRKKEKRKEKIKEIGKNTEYNNVLENGVTERIDGKGDDVGTEEVLKLRKKEKRKEKLEEISNYRDSEDGIEEENVTDYKINKFVKENGDQTEVTKQGKEKRKEKTKRSHKLDSDDQGDKEIIGKFDVKGEDFCEEISKPRKKEKRKEKANESNNTGCDERVETKVTDCIGDKFVGNDGEVSTAKALKKREKTKKKKQKQKRNCAKKESKAQDLEGGKIRVRSIPFSTSCTFFGSNLKNLKGYGFGLKMRQSKC